VVVATLPEKPMMDDLVDVQLIEEGVAILYTRSDSPQFQCTREDIHTLETDAVKTTTS
jgi:hypothetical protein